MLALAASELLRQRQDVRQLERAVNLAVRRQNLLDQRRTGSRQADDEDRVRRRVPDAVPLLEEFRRAYTLLGGHILSHLLGIVAAKRLLECVAALVVGERRLEVALVLEGFA